MTEVLFVEDDEGVKNDENEQNDEDDLDDAQIAGASDNEECNDGDLIALLEVDKEHEPEIQDVGGECLPPACKDNDLW